MIRNKAHGNAIGSTRFYDHDAEASEIKIGYTFFLGINGAAVPTSASRS